MRLLVILYAGDYREAYQRMLTCDGETYYGHRYAVQSLINIGQKIEEVAVLCCKSQESYNELLTPGFRVIGTGFHPQNHKKELLKIIHDYQPTHVVLRTPLIQVLSWLTRRQIPTLVMFADSFLRQNISSKLRYWRMVWQLNRSCVQWVSNHGVNSSYALCKLGVNANKLIPWDWPHSRSPREYPPKKLTIDHKPWQLIYVGSINISKGVSDLLETIAILKKNNLTVTLKIAGKGHIDAFKLQAKTLGIEEIVDFLGLVPNDTIVERMREADLVLVPSRHEYPEGFPLTIYEALCSHTPIVASDHPMFSGVLSHKTSAMIFPAGNSQAMAQRIEHIMTNAELYSNISAASLNTWEKLQIPVKWAELIERWLFMSTENEQWLIKHSLNAGIYNFPSLIR